MAYFIYRDERGRYHYIAAHEVEHLEEVVLTCPNEEDARERVTSLNFTSAGQPNPPVLLPEG
jgi:hypothetical protein